MYVAYEYVNFVFLICQIFVYVVYKYAKSSLVCQVNEHAKFYIWSIKPIYQSYDISRSHSHDIHNIRIHTCTSVGHTYQSSL